MTVNRKDQYILGPEGQDERFKRVAALMRHITGNNWRASKLNSRLMTTDPSPILARYAN